MAQHTRAAALTAAAPVLRRTIGARFGRGGETQFDGGAQFNSNSKSMESPAPRPSKFLFSDRKRFTFGKGAVAMGVDAHEGAAAVQRVECGLIPLFGAAAKIFHLDWVMTKVEDSIAHGAAIFFQIFVGGRDENLP